MDVFVRCMILCVVLGLTAAWTQGLSRHSRYASDSFPFPWAPARRSAYVQCAGTNERCETTDQCCNLHDVCLTSVKYNPLSGEKGRFSTCKDVHKEMKYSKLQRPLKASGQSCTDSLECEDLCCREVRGHRSRYYVCGTPIDEFMTYTCVKKSRSENDVLDPLM